MPTVNQRALVAYSAKQMYDLVNDYEQLFWVCAGCVARRTLILRGTTSNCRVVISKAGINQKFTAKPNATLSFHQNAIGRGPFLNFTGRMALWRSERTISIISLDLSFEFSNPVISFAFGQIFTHLTGKMVDALNNAQRRFIIVALINIEIAYALPQRYFWKKWRWMKEPWSGGNSAIRYFATIYRNWFAWK